MRGAVQLLLGVSQRVEQGAVGGALHTFGHVIASHGKVLLIKSAIVV